MDEKDTTQPFLAICGTLSPTLLWRREIHRLTDGQQSHLLDISVFPMALRFISELPEESDEDLPEWRV